MILVLGIIDQDSIIINNLIPIFSYDIVNIYKLAHSIHASVTFLVNFSENF
jgi:hypothetical protein